MNFQEAKNDFVKLMDLRKAYQYADDMIYWDAMTGAPIKGMNVRSKMRSLLQAESYKILLSNKMRECIDTLKEQIDRLDILTQGLLVIAERDLKNIGNIPREEYHQYTELCSKAGVIWEEAKKKSDFSLLSPYLEKMITMLKRFSEYKGYEDNIYEGLIDNNESGMTVASLDEYFSVIKAKLIPLIGDIQQKGKNVSNSFLYKYYSKEKQREFACVLLDFVGYDMDAGMISNSEHPYTMEFDITDVRFTQHIYENAVMPNIFSTLHESGHAIYEQNMDERLSGTLLARKSSCAISESQSRMFENIFGRNVYFWEYMFPRFKDMFPEQTKDVTFKEFYHAINVVKMSPIRIHADELTYPLHIILRYEIEKELFDGNIEVKDLPDVWNKKMKEYLGINVKSDAEGVLQDMHWPGGLIGYFQSYTLGDMYAVQFDYAMRKSIDVDDLLKNGEFKPIRKWLKENVHKFGNLKTPHQIVMDATKEPLNPTYYIEYLEKKYKRLYDL